MMSITDTIKLKISEAHFKISDTNIRSKFSLKLNLKIPSKNVVKCKKLLRIDQSSLKQKGD